MKNGSQHSEKILGMQGLVNKKDWSRTSLGPKQEWPQSLQSLVGLLLDHPLPTVLLWGPELIQIYNDGYRKILADKHPEALGQPMQECWPELWHINYPTYKIVLEEGKSAVLEDQFFPLGRHEFEETYFTISYIPARNDVGDVAGVLLTIFQTTERKDAEKKLLDSKSSLNAFVTATSEVVYRMSPDWSEMYYLDGRQFIVDTTKPRKTWLEEYIPTKEQPRVMDAIQEAIQTKSMLDLEHQVIRADGTMGWTYSRAIPLLNKEREIMEWFGTATDITERKHLEQKLTVELEAIKRLQEVSTQSIQKGDGDGLYDAVLETAIDLLDADFGTIQRLNPHTQELDMFTYRGFSAEAIAKWARVDVETSSSCGRALQKKERVIIPDVNMCKFIKDGEDIAAFNRVGIRSMQSTPLISRSGELLGMLSTHWADPHQPSKRDLHLLDVLARQVSDMIQQRLSFKAMRESEERQRFLLELSDRIRTLKTGEEIGSVCTHFLGKELKLDRAYFVRFDNEREEAHVGTEYHTPELDPISGIYSYLDFPESIQRIQKNKLVFDNIFGDSSLPPKENKDLRDLGIAALAGIPIQIENKHKHVDIVLCAVFSRPHKWSDAEIALLEETAERAWAAIKRAEAEQELRGSEERLQMAQDTAQLGYWELNIETNTFSCSSICKSHFGRTPGDSLTYDDIIESIHPEDWKRKKQTMKIALQTGEGYELEYRIYWPDGTRRWIYTRARYLSESELSGVTLDITEQKEIEEELEQRTRALQTSRMKLRSLVNELSRTEENQRFILAGELHDNLGQILEVSKMKFDLLMRNRPENIPDEVYEIRDLINESIKCVRRLVNDLKPTPAEEKENLYSALKWVAGKMEKHGLVVHIENGQEHKPMALGSLNTLVQVVQELLFNVVKHAEVDQAWIFVNRSDQFIQIKVEDEGEGFDPKQHEESTGQEGFGLFNVRQRIDLMGGTFNIESKPGQGTSALLQIPLKNVDPSEENLKSDKSISYNGPVTSTTHTVISVLVVDDHQMMREGIAGIINTENDMYVADEASTGEEAIRMVGEVKPDVVIMDLNLPGISGIDATKKIKADHPHIKIIGISFRNSQDLVNNVLKAGASDFVGKDETLQSICQAIREAVG